MAYQVFISHSNDDNSFIDLLKEQLKDAGFDVWIARELLQPGRNWREEIDNAIKASFALVAVMTPSAYESKYVTYEWAYALGLGKIIFPILLESTDLHPRLEAIQYIDFRDHWTLDWERLIKPLQQVATGLSDSKEPIPPFIQRAVAALDSYDLSERRAAIDSLTQSSHPAAIEALAQAVEHHIDDVRGYAALTLARVTNCSDERALLGLFDAASIDFPTTREYLVRYKSPDALEVFFEIVRNNKNFRNYLLSDHNIYPLYQPNMFHVLVRGLHDENPLVQEYAAVGLGIIRDVKAIPDLEASLRNHDNFAAANALGNLADPKAIDALTGTLIYAAEYNKDRMFRVCAMALGRMGTDLAVKSLGEILDRTTNVLQKIFLLEALGKTKQPSAISFICKYLEDSEESQDYVVWHPSDIVNKRKERRVFEIAATALVELDLPEALAALEEWKKQHEES